jgi:hypothetical protein
MSSSTESSQKENNAEPATEKKKVPSNYYFIEHEVAPLIQEWQEYYQRQVEIETYLYGTDDDGEEYFLSPQQRESLEAELQKNLREAQPLLDEIMRETAKVIKGVIFRAQFHKREKYDTCSQIATEACIKSLRRFNPEFGTAFNYLSLTAKNSIRYHLIKKAKKKSLSLDYEYMDDDNLKLKNLVKQEEKTLRSLEIENLSDTILVIIEEEKEQKGLITVAHELREYLFYNQGKYDKKEFFKWAKSDGVSSNLLRKFIKFIKDHKERLYKEVGVF